MDTQLLKSLDKKKTLKGELEREIDLKIWNNKKKKKKTQQNRETGDSVYMCVFLDMCARKWERQTELVKVF